MRLVALLLALGVCCLAEPAKVDVSGPVGQAFVRLYNFDFRGAHAILDGRISHDPQDPLPYAVKAAAHLYSELDRLKVLQMDFFEDNERVADRRRLTPDPAVRSEFFRLIEEARKRATARLSSKPGDREALFALCMTTGLRTDYAGLIDRRRLGALSLVQEDRACGTKLLALNPPFWDAYMTAGSIEYVVSSLPFYIRWFVHIDQIEGSTQKAIEDLRIVAERGKYCGPFARILLSVIYLRDKRPGDAENLLAGLASEFPENPLIRRELARAGELARRSAGGAAPSSERAAR
jgi:predicted Zn-dependent protease